MMVSRYVPWWQQQTTQRRRTMEAAQFRREAQASVFRADTSSSPGTLGDEVRKGDENSRPFPIDTGAGSPDAAARGPDLSTQPFSSGPTVAAADQGGAPASEGSGLMAPLRGVKDYFGRLGSARAPLSSNPWVQPLLQGTIQPAVDLFRMANEPLVGDQPGKLGSVAEELTRPINYLGAAVRGLSFLPKAPLLARAAVEGASAIAGRAAGEGVYQATAGAPEPVRQVASVLANMGGNFASGAAIGRVAEQGFVPFAKRFAASEAGSALIPGPGDFAGHTPDFTPAPATRGPAPFEATPLAMLKDLEQLPEPGQIESAIANINRQLDAHVNAAGDYRDNRTTRALFEQRGKAEALAELRSITDAAGGDAEKAANYLLDSLDSHQAWEESRTVNRGRPRSNGIQDAASGRYSGKIRTSRTASEIAGAPVEPIEVLRARFKVLSDVHGALVDSKSLDDVLAPVRDAKAAVESAIPAETVPTRPAPNPEQATLEGGAVPTLRPENVPTEQQAAMGIGSGTRPIEDLPMFRGEAQGAAPPEGAFNARMDETLKRVDAERPAREAAKKNPPAAFTQAIADLKAAGHKVAKGTTWDGGWLDYRGTTKAGEALHGGGTATTLDDAIRLLRRSFRESDLPTASAAEQLPRELRGAKPRVSQRNIAFSSDLDKALYIVANPTTKSKAHDAYMEWLRQQIPGVPDTEIVHRGQLVRADVVDASRAQPGAQSVEFNGPPTNTALTPDEIVANAADRQAAIERQTGRPPTPQVTNAPREAPSKPPPGVVGVTDQPEVAAHPVVKADLEAMQARVDGGENARQAFIDAGAPDGGAVATAPPPVAAGGAGTPPRQPPPAPPGGGGTQPPLNLNQPGSAAGRAGGRAGRTGIKPAQALAYIAARKVPGERIDQALLRLHEGAISEMEQETRILMEAGNDRLQALGFGVKRGGRLVMRDSDVATMDKLYEALHYPSKVASGEVQIPQGLEAIYHELRGLTDWEQAARIDFDPAQATIEDYFYRGWWKKPTDTGQPAGGSLGRTPGFRRQREDLSYRGMRDQGYEPASWNPYEQWAFARRMGERYRHQMELIDYLKSLGVAVPHAGGDVPKGWRVPQIGPAFQGKAIAFLDQAGKSTGMRTRQWLVEGRVANPLENLYGVRPNLWHAHLALPGGRTAEIDILKALDAATFIPKSAKLVGSFFQQIDFLTRNAIGHTTRAVDELAHGRPIESVKSIFRIPKSSFDIVRSNFDPAFRKSLGDQLLDTNSLLEGRQVSFRDLVRNDLSTSDATIFTRDMEHTVADVVQQGLKDNLLAPVRILKGISRAMQNGLFEGVYRAAILTDIRNNIAPMLAKQFPDLSDDALAGMIAKVANLKYSTIPASQSVIQNRFVRETLRRLIFSTNETEALLRQATNVFHGNNKAFWAKHWVGAYATLLATAEVIHYASTGEGLPLGRWSPVSKGGFGPLPFGYNRDFVAPDLPLAARGGARLSLDLMGQLDTVFRLLDPAGFLSSRQSVPIRAVWNQIRGTDFMGNAIDTVGPGGIYSSTAQLAYDLGAPIGIGQAAVQLARERNPQLAGLLPAGEARVGDTGATIQALGANVRAETNQQVYDRIAKESGITTPYGPAQKWDDLTPGQKQDARNARPDLKAELARRSVEAAQTDSVYPQAEQARAGIDTERVHNETELGKKLDSGEVDTRTFWDQYHDITLQSVAAKKQANTDFNVFQDTGQLPSHPGQAAYVRWLHNFDVAEGGDGIMDPGDWDKLDELQTSLQKEVGPQAWAYTQDRADQAHPPQVTLMLKAREIVNESEYRDIPDTVLQERAAELLPANVQATSVAQLQTMQRQALARDDSGLAVTIKSALNAIDRDAAERKVEYRLANPQIDRALQLAYGLQPADSSGSAKKASFGSSSSSYRRERARTSERSRSRTAAR